MRPKWIYVSLIILLLSAGCKNNQQGKMTGKMEDKIHQDDEAILYTCPMHHQIKSHKPGKCPICGMTLIPVKPTRQQKKDSTQMITLSARQQFLGNIHTDTAMLKPFFNQLMLTGNAIFDPRKENIVSAWVSGWIEKMYVRNPGEPVKDGQKLYELYSPDLLSTEKDYLLAVKQKDLYNKASVDLTGAIQAMKQKLLRWGLSENQIDHLSDRELTDKITVYSKASGFLIEKMKEEGDYVKEGDAIMNLADNKTLWVQAQLYDNELPVLNNKHEITVAFPAFPDKMFSGKIVFNNPVNNNHSRVHLLNIAIPNSNGQIQPGMLAYVYLQIAMEKSEVIIPKSAVLYEEKSNYVWIQLPRKYSDSSNCMFERREVGLGIDNNNMIQVLHGIAPGDIVVSSGAYLVNSEYILQYGSGANLSGMTMSDMKMKGKGN